MTHKMGALLGVLVLFEVRQERRLEIPNLAWTVKAFSILFNFIYERGSIIV